MARKRYIETHSNYTLKRMHQSTSKGNIYESDIMTITELGGYAPGQIPIYADSNFKMSVREGLTNKLKHEASNWLVNDNCSQKTTVWTYNCLGSSSTSTLNQIVVKPDYSELSEFAYYGSAVELIRASVDDIIKRFPGELVLTRDHYMVYKDNVSSEQIPLGGEDKYIVRNPFNINVHSHFMPPRSKMSSLRYFSESWQKYTLIGKVYPIYCPGQEVGEDLKWYVEDFTKVICADDGDLITKITLGAVNLYYYYYKGEVVLLHDFDGNEAYIRPKDEYVEEFFNSLDEFQSQLLNRYKAYKWKLKTPRETDKGIFVTLDTYQWPVEDNWNLDISSSAYQSYLNRLMDVAELYDKYYSDNVVRSLTHEALKNFDWTHTKVTDETTTVYTDPNPYRIEAMLHVYGRQFDFLRLYAKNIKNGNSITYSGINDVPDYFLKEKLSIAGWEVKNIVSGASDVYTTKMLYPSDRIGYTYDDANNKFLRVLALNSNAILNAKGTKRGIEMLMALFGFHSLDYYKKRTYSSGRTWSELTDNEQRKCYESLFNFTEYVGVAYNSEDTSTIGYERCDNEIVRSYNARKDGYMIPLNDYNSLDEVELQGLPVKPVTVTLTDGTETTYLVPWYDKTAETSYEYGSYFQSKGGWGETKVKYDQVPTYGEIEIISDDDFTIYEETNKYLHFALNISALLSVPYVSLNDNDIYFVNDITDLAANYSTITETGGTFSHYFALIDADNSNILGEDENGWGWRNITEEELKGQTTSYAKQTLYLETLENDNKGNNPHVGYGNYDSGKDYIDSYRTLFKNATFENTSDTFIEGYEDIGFDIEIQPDNTKCWYFSDTTNDDASLRELEEVDSNDFSSSEMPDITFDDATRLRPTNTQVGYLVPFNMEGNGLYYDEAAANSIINLKNFDIEFYPNAKMGNSLYDFIANVVMYYVKQIVPSTTILKYIVPDAGIVRKESETKTENVTTTSDAKIKSANSKCFNRY